MAAAAVAFIGVKAVDAESTTGWNTGNLDNDIFVENAGSVGAKVSNTTGDFYDVNASNHDFSSGGANEGDHIFAWFNTLTPVSLHAIIAVEDAATDGVGAWNVGPETGYGGGWINYVIDPARQFDTIIQAGTPVFTTSANPSQLHNVDGYGGRHTTSTSIMGNFNNALVDAISVGTGYRVTGGDGASADAKFSDIISYEQTVTNRFGALRTAGGVLFMMSKIVIGNTGTVNTDFTDDGFTVVWLDALVASTFYEMSLLQGTGVTNLTLSNGILKGESPTQNGLILFDFSGGTAVALTNILMSVARSVVFDSACTVDACDISTVALTQGSAEIKNSKIRTQSATSVACLQDPVFGASDLHDTEFIQDGAGHAIEIDTAGSYTLTNINFTGYGIDTSDSAAIDVTASSGTVTLNIVGGDTPTYKTAGATVVIVANPVTTTVKAVDQAGNNVASARCRVMAGSGGPLPYAATPSSLVSTGTTATLTFSAAHNLKTGEKILVEGANESAYNGTFAVTVSSTTVVTYTMASDPADTATGTIKVTGVIIAELTTAGGIADDTRTFSSNQPIDASRSWVRKSSAADNPKYKTAPIGGTIDSASGLSVQVLMIEDE